MTTPPAATSYIRLVDPHRSLLRRSCNESQKVAPTSVDAASGRVHGSRNPDGALFGTQRFNSFGQQNLVSDIPGLGLDRP